MAGQLSDLSHSHRCCRLPVLLLASEHRQHRCCLRAASPKCGQPACLPALLQLLHRRRRQSTAVRNGCNRCGRPYRCAVIILDAQRLVVGNGMGADASRITANSFATPKQPSYQEAKYPPASSKAYFDCWKYFKLRWVIAPPYRRHFFHSK